MPKTDLEKLAKTSQTTKQGQTLAELEQRLVDEVDGRKEERFYWILTIVVLIDFIAIGYRPSYLLIFPFLLELAILISLARRLQVEEAVILLERIEQFIFKRLDKVAKE